MPITGTGSFKQSVMQVSFTLAQGGFAGGGNTATLNTLQLSNLRMTAKAVNAGGAAMGELQLAIYGMVPSQMNTLSTLGMRVQQIPIRNTVTLMAGKRGDAALSTVFQGGIQAAYADLEQQPDVVFRVVAKSGLPQAVTSYDSTSLPGSADVAVILAKMASDNGLAFENNKVSVIGAEGQHYWGSARSQIQQCCENYNIGWTIEKNTLIIWPQNGTRTGGPTIISADTGMIGYPAYTAMGVRFRTLYNPALRFQGSVKIVLADNDPIKLPISVWTVYKLEHDLSSEYPHGNWESVAESYNPDFPQPVTN